MADPLRRRKHDANDTFLPDEANTFPIREPVVPWKYLEPTEILLHLMGIRTVGRNNDRLVVAVSMPEPRRPGRLNAGNGAPKR